MTCSGHRQDGEQGRNSVRDKLRLKLQGALLTKQKAASSSGVTSSTNLSNSNTSDNLVLGDHVAQRTTCLYFLFMMP